MEQGRGRPNQRHSEVRKSGFEPISDDTGGRDDN
jgi:hypothetical protein